MRCTTISRLHKAHAAHALSARCARNVFSSQHALVPWTHKVRDSCVSQHALRMLRRAARVQVREAAEGGSDGRLFMAVDKELVAQRVGELLKKQDLSKYVL